jgi:hypothetical protein
MAVRADRLPSLSTAQATQRSVRTPKLARKWTVSWISHETCSRSARRPRVAFHHSTKNPKNMKNVDTCPAHQLDGHSPNLTFNEKEIPFPLRLP